jgi:hypothetical protein
MMVMNRAFKQLLCIGTLVSIPLVSVPAQAGHWENTLHPQINTAQLTANPLTSGGFAVVSGLDPSADVHSSVNIDTVAGAYAGNPTNVPVGGQGADVGYTGFDYSYHWVADNEFDYAPAFGIRIVKSWAASAGAGVGVGGTGSASASSLPADPYYNTSTVPGATGIAANPGTFPPISWNYLWGGPFTPNAYYTDSAGQILTGGRIGYSTSDAAIDVAHEFDWVELLYPPYHQVRDGVDIWGVPGHNEAIVLPTVSLRTSTVTNGFADSVFMHSFKVQGFPLP